MHAEQAWRGTRTCHGSCLAYVQLLRRTPRVSWAELVLGVPLILPGQPVDLPEPPGVDLPPPPTRPSSYAAAADTPPSHVAEAMWVYVRRGGQLKPLVSPYVGPFQVLRGGAKTFTLQIGEKQEVVSVDRLPSHTGTALVSPAVPASRGQPR